MTNIISWNVNIELSRALAARREIIANRAALSSRTRHYCRITNIFHDIRPTCGYVCLSVPASASRSTAAIVLHITSYQQIILRNMITCYKHSPRDKQNIRNPHLCMISAKEQQCYVTSRCSRIKKICTLSPVVAASKIS